MKTTVSDVLRRIGEIWMQAPTKGAFARDISGKEVPSKSPDAVSWCLTGARFRAAHELSASEETSAAAYRTLSTAANSMGIRGIANLNDNSPELVPDVLSEAIEAAEALKL